MHSRKTAAVLMLGALLLFPAPALACKKKGFQKEKPQISQVDEKKPESSVASAKSMKPKTAKEDKSILVDEWNGYTCMILDGKIRVVDKDAAFFKEYDVKEANLKDAVAIFCDGDSIMVVTKNELLIFYGIERLASQEEADRTELWGKCSNKIDGLDVVAAAADENVVIVIGRKGILFTGRKNTDESLSDTLKPSECGDIPSKKFFIMFPESTKAEDIFWGASGNAVFVTYKGADFVYRFKLSDDKTKVETGKPVQCLGKFKKVPVMEKKEDHISISDGNATCLLSSD